MELIVKIVSAPGVPGNKALALCTVDGEMLPMQHSCAVETEAAEIGLVTVKFWIDGEKIRFADNDG
jgi:hypothetical protein